MSVNCNHTVLILMWMAAIRIPAY